MESSKGNNPNTKGGNTMKEIKIQFYNGDEMVIRHVTDFTLVNSYLHITRNGFTEEFQKVQFLVYAKYE